MQVIPSFFDGIPENDIENVVRFVSGPLRRLNCPIHLRWNILGLYNATGGGGSESFFLRAIHSYSCAPEVLF